MMKTLFLYSAILVVINLAIQTGRLEAADNTSTQDQEPDSPERQHLRGAVFGFAPWGMTVDGRSIGARALPHGQEYAGVMPDMIHAISKSIGEPVELVPVSYTRMFALLKSGQVDFAFFFRSNDSEKIAKPLVKTHEMRTVIVTRPETALTVRGSIDDLIFASPRSVRYDPAFDQNKKLQRIFTLDYTEAVNLLAKKRVTAVIGPDIFLSYSFRLQGLVAADYVILKPVSRNDVYLQFSYRSPLIHKMDQVAEVAQEMTDQGVFRQILKRHFTSLEVPFQELAVEAAEK